MLDKIQYSSIRNDAYWASLPVCAVPVTQLRKVRRPYINRDDRRNLGIFDEGRKFGTEKCGFLKQTRPECDECFSLCMFSIFFRCIYPQWVVGELGHCDILLLAEHHAKGATFCLLPCAFLCFCLDGGLAARGVTTAPKDWDIGHICSECKVDVGFATARDGGRVTSWGVGTDISTAERRCVDITNYAEN